MLKFLLVLAIVVSTAFAQHHVVVCWPHPSCPLVDVVQTFFPHVDCGKFYKCNKGIKCEMNCPAGLHWSVALVRCEWPNIACCDPRIPCEGIPSPPIPTIPVPPVTTAAPIPTIPVDPNPTTVGPIPTIPVDPIDPTPVGPTTVGPIPTIPVPPVRIIY
uniref:(northern house mosquito) hypothetical protein n=2 Tax=Culex pipiens TaxID=7175 RepID=A0A8D8A6Z3_CULPI